MTYPATPTVWLEPTDQVAVGLRRYALSRSDADGHGCATGYHSAMVYTGTAPAVYRDDAAGCSQNTPRRPTTTLAGRLRAQSAATSSTTTPGGRTGRSCSTAVRTPANP